VAWLPGGSAHTQRNPCSRRQARGSGGRSGSSNQQ
jgi:hypothetical protein